MEKHRDPPPSPKPEKKIVKVEPKPDPNSDLDREHAERLKELKEAAEDPENLLDEITVGALRAQDRSRLPTQNRGEKVMKHNLPKNFTLGEIQGEDWLQLKMEHLSRHICVWGSTGVGKTMIALAFMQQLVSQGIGFTFITPHPDGREKLLHWANLSNVGPERIVDCTPVTKCCVSLDPFANMPKNLNRLQEETRLQAECKRVMSAILSNVPLADQEVMNQLNTWMMNSLYLCGKRVNGDYLGLQKALMLFDVDHPEFEPTMNRLLPVIPDYMRADWNVYRGTKNVNQRRVMGSSTINRYRRSIFANPIITGMFAKRANAINDEEVIKKTHDSHRQRPGKRRPAEGGRPDHRPDATERYAHSSQADRYEGSRAPNEVLLHHRR